MTNEHFDFEKARMKTPSRGERNNNPLNIRHSADKWQGLTPEQKDYSFCSFANIYYGFRAAVRILCSYRKRYGLFRLKEVISRWAPPKENNTERYIAFVAHEASLTPDSDVFKDADTLYKVMRGMTLMECGYFKNEWQAPLLQAVKETAFSR